MIILIYVIIGIIFGLSQPNGVKGFIFAFLMWPLIATALVGLILSTALGYLIMKVAVALGVAQDLE